MVATALSIPRRLRFPRPLHVGLLDAVCLLFALLCGPAAAHPLPISSVELEYGVDRIEGRVFVHMRDLAPGLGIAPPGDAPDPAPFLARAGAIERQLGERLSVGGQHPRWRTIVLVPGDPDALRLDFAIPGTPPGEVAITALLFPQDPLHQTFLNVYEGGELRQQWLLSARGGPVTYFSGSSAGVLAAAAAFLRAGVHHILIGPDHVLFVIGLILLGGALRRLLLIVTAFTIGHSVTLSLAALDLFVLPARIIEPAIALSIVAVGVDNLVRGQRRDIRAALAFAFGLVHGFGFAYVLRDFGLPEAHRAAALLSFNLGVEIGQIAIVLAVVAVMALVRSRSARIAQIIEIGGSLAVTAAGAYWFVDRAFFS